MPAGEFLCQQDRSAQVHGHMRVELLSIERAQFVIGEAGGIVDEEAHRRKLGGGCEYRFRTSGIRLIGDPR